MVKGKTSLERALNRAMALGTPAYRVDARTYTVPASDGRSAYTVLVTGSDYACTCMAGQQGRVCYHVGATMMAVQAARLETAAPATRETAVLHTPRQGRRDLYGDSAA